MQYRTWLNHRINLEFSEADNQPLSSSSRADNVTGPTLPSVCLYDDSVSGDISIPPFSSPAGQSMSSSDDAYPPPLSGQETSQGSLEREFTNIDDGQGYDDLPAIMMDESLETGFEGDGYGDETIFHTESIARSMPLLATVLAIFSIFLMAFAGLPQ
ncbi:hypothetical protein AYX14_07044 [Cryptococcus neoformans]|nr:hypothetical protein AYX14_07044 [Cryptococcus neoformans var. grubii]